MIGLSRLFFASFPLFLTLALFSRSAAADHAPIVGGAPIADNAPTADNGATVGPTVQAMRAAFPGRPMREVDDVSFRRFVAMHASEGRLLTGSALAASIDATTDQASDSLPAVCRSLPPQRRAACRDSVSLAKSQEPRALREIGERAAREDSIAKRADSLDRARVEGHRRRNTEDTLGSGTQVDHTETQERTRGYFSNFILDLHGNWDMDGNKWTAIIYVVVGVVVVGAFIIYGGQALVELITNQDHDPVFREIGLRYSYSGRQWSDGGPPLYRNANLFGLRFGIGLDRNGMGLGVAVEGGYIDLSLRPVDNPAKVFDFQGGYLVAGPMLRFGHNDPLSLTLEFLNGASDHPSIGWISKSRMTVQTRVGRSGWLMGAHLGAVFYDLSFNDGLAQREGNFNRDLSLVIGADTGWEF